MPDAGVPAMVAVPLPLFVNVTALGSDPDSLRAGVGEPVVVTVKLPAEPTVKVVLFALVIAGAAVPAAADLNDATAAAHGSAELSVALDEVEPPNT